MKTSIFRQILAVLILITSLIYFNCDDSGLKPENQYCVSGTISGWTLGSKTLYAYVRSVRGGSYSVANCPVDAQGNFNLCLPSSVSDTILFRADSIFYGGCSGNVTFNPFDARGTEISSLKVKSGDTVIGYIRKNNYNTLYAGAFSVEHIYVNQNVSVSGDYEYCFPGDTLKFSGSVTAGWNKIVKNYTRVDTSGNTILYNLTEPSGAVWKYTSYTDGMFNEDENRFHK